MLAVGHRGNSYETSTTNNKSQQILNPIDKCETMVSILGIRIFLSIIIYYVLFYHQMRIFLFGWEKLQRYCKANPSGFKVDCEKILIRGVDGIGY